MVSPVLRSQNVGQKGDSLVNYMDINGKKQGKWAKKYPNGNKAYEGYFIDDQPEGKFVRYHENGALMSVQLCTRNPSYCKTTLYFSEDKIAATGNHLNQEKDSIWKYFNQEGKLIRQEGYKEGKKHGLFLTYYDNGKIAEQENFVEGRQSGMWLQYYENGKKKLEAEFSNGMRNGKFYMYYDSGRIKLMGRYTNDLRDKTWIFYDEKGGELMTIVYEKGKAANQEELNEAQQKEFEEFEKNKGKFEEPADYVRRTYMYDGF